MDHRLHPICQRCSCPDDQPCTWAESQAEAIYGEDRQ